MDVIVGGRARRDPRLVPALALLGLLLAGALGAALIGSQLLRRQQVVPPAQTRIALPARVVEVIAATDGAIWVSTTTDPPLQAMLPVAIHRIDAATGTVRTVADELPDGHVSFTVTDGSIWASFDEGRQAIRWDAITGEQIQTVAIGDLRLEPIAAYGWVWHPNYADGTVTRIDPQSGANTTIPTGWVEGPRALAAGGLVWAVSPRADWVVGIDPESASVVREIRNLSFLQSCGIGYAADRVWVSRCESAGIEVFDPDSGTSLGIFEPAGASEVSGVFEHNGRTWLRVVSGIGQVSVVAVDPTSLAVIAEYPTRLSAGPIAVGPDALWFGIESELVNVPFSALPAR